MNEIDVVEQNIVELDTDILKILLKDRTTNKNIIWATDYHYNLRGGRYAPESEIKVELITGRTTDIIQPRVAKDREEQTRRTRDKAEVFTPSWICNKQNNLIDGAWFGYENVFNVEIENKWITKQDEIHFPDGKTWKDYVQDVRLEISCGEAPYLVSRYDTVTGNFIPIKDRIGLLDRKLRIIGENTTTEQTWYRATLNAFRSIYGFEFQGDNLLIARENLLYTFIDYYTDRFRKEPSISQLKTVSEIISWNIWQMDGITMCVPYTKSQDLEEYEQLSLNLFDDIIPEVESKDNPIYCKIYDWEKKEIVEFKTIGGI